MRITVNKDTIGYWFFSPKFGYDGRKYKNMKKATLKRKHLEIEPILNEFGLDLDTLDRIEMDPNDLQPMDWAEEDEAIRNNYFACLVHDILRLHVDSKGKKVKVKFI